jgi:hypothetical protein
MVVRSDDELGQNARSLMAPPRAHHINEHVGYPTRPFINLTYSSPVSNHFFKVVASLGQLTFGPKLLRRHKRERRNYQSSLLIFSTESELSVHA